MSEDGLDGWFQGRVHVRPVRIYYEDTDFSGIVYHANYLKFFERGRTDFLRCAGVGHADLLSLDQPLVFAVTRIETDFKAPARIDDLLHVRTVFDGARGARFSISQDIVRGEDLIAAAMVTAACVTPDGRPRRLPSDVVRKVAPHLGDGPS